MRSTSALVGMAAVVVATLLAAPSDARAACTVTSVSPADGAVVSNSPSIQWTGSGCNWYRVVYSPSGDFGADQVVASWRAHTWFLMAESVWESYQAGAWADGVYWKVEGRSVGGSVGFSSARWMWMDPDYDDDGWSEGGGDCDDHEPRVYPGAAERCNFMDDDCDGVADNGLGSDYWWPDGDGDGYGAGEAFHNCVGIAPIGYVGNDDDCDDADAGVSPGAAEACHDGVDNDCDGWVDLGCVGAIGYGDLVITEIMQNPSLVADTSGEWFEVYNSTSSTIDLSGVVVQDLDTDSFTVSGFVPVGPGEYVVLGLNGDAATNGGVAVDYVYSGLTLANSDDELELVWTDGTSIDLVAWDGGPNFPDPTGKSMSLDPSLLDAASNDSGGAWCEASTLYNATDAGTPGVENDVCP